MTYKEKWAKIEELSNKQISTFNINSQNVKQEIQKGSLKLRILHQILMDEIKRHNSNLERQVTRLRNTGTTD